MDILEADIYYYSGDATPGSGTSPTTGGIFVGYVTNGGSFPTARLDGTALQNEDYIKVSASSTFPFSIGGITFTSSKDTAIYLNGNWYLQPGLIQDTSETPLKDAPNESLSGTKTTQKEVNIENKIRLNEIINKGERDDANSKLVLTKYNNDKIEVDEMVFKNNTIEIKNKTIDADYNLIKNIETDNFKAGVIKDSIDDENPSKEKLISEYGLVNTKYIKKPDVAPGEELIVGLDENNKEKFYYYSQIAEKVFEFTTPTKIWNINHNKDRYPEIRLLDNTGKIIYGEITYIDVNNIEVEFLVDTAGKAIVS